MTISRAIIDDLYPLYEAGEASADSRALVEEFLTENPGAAATLKSAVSLPPVEPPPDLEVRALKGTARLLEERSLLGAAALSLSYIPSAVGFIDGGQLHLLYLDWPWLAGLIYVAAIGLWIRFLQVCARVQATGLRPRQTWTARLVWALSGTMIGAAVTGPLQHWSRWHSALYLPYITSALALMLGEWLCQIATPAQINRPTTIFGPHDDDGEN